MTTTHATTPDTVRAVLRGVIDPELHADIVDLGMVGDISIDVGVVTVPVALTTSGCPLRHQIASEIRSKVSVLPGVIEVDVEYSELDQAGRSAVMQRARLNASRNAPETSVPATTRIIAVASGKGGVGKSSISANLALALALRGLKVGVLDADIWGFSVPRMLGLTGRLGAQPDKDGNGRIQPHAKAIDGDGSIEVVSTGLLLDDEDTALMWRGLMLSKALEQFLTDVAWGDLDYLVIDMPPGTGDIQMALARLLPQAELLIVTTPGINAQKVAARVADMARRSYLKVIGIVENMSEFVAPDGSRHAIFGSGGGDRLAELSGSDVLARIPIEPALAEGSDLGTPVVVSAPQSPAAGALTDLAELLATEVLPPLEMAGCTARMLDQVEAALSDRDPATA